MDRLRINRVAEICRVGLAAGPAPLAIANLYDWWQVRPGNLWQDSAGTTPAVVATDPVGKWTGRFGGFALTQATAGKRPLLQTTGSFLELAFDGVDDCLFNSAVAEWDTGPYTLYAVANPPSSGTQGFVSPINGAANDSCIAYGWNAGPIAAIKAFTASQTASGINADGTWRRWSWRSAGSSGGTLAAWTGRRDGTDAAGAVVGLTTLTEIGGLIVGQVNNSTDRYTGRLRHLLLYTRVLSATELAALDGYFLGQL